MVLLILVAIFISKNGENNNISKISNQNQNDLQSQSSVENTENIANENINTVSDSKENQITENKVIKNEVVENKNISTKNEAVSNTRNSK